MATSLLYLGLCLGPYSILVTASSGGICVYSCYSCYSYYGVAGAAIKITSKAASKISRAYIDGAYIDKAYVNKAYIDGAYTDGAYRDRAYRGAYCRA